MNERDKLIFEQLKQILLEEDRKAFGHENQKLLEKVNEINRLLSERDKLEQRIKPILVDNEKHLQENFSELFGTNVTATIKKQIKESQDEVVEALYPIMGKLIKKFVQREMEILSEKIDQQVKALSTWKGIMGLFKSKISGVKTSEVIISKTIDPVVEEVFIIQKQTGFLIASYSSTNVVDHDLIAGMLTAIRTFVEEAFNKKDQHLETVQYENYNILLFTFATFYIAVSTSGPMTAAFRSKLEDTVNTFVDQLNMQPEVYLKDINYQELLNKLANSFYIYGKHE